MSHECDDCGEEFETLSRLRLHDCSTDTSFESSSPTHPDERKQEDVEEHSNEERIGKLDDLLATVRNGDSTALHQAMATYETRLASAHESERSNRYRNISRAYREELITALDDATQAEGFAFLAEFLDAYHPETADDLPHVTTVLQNVSSRYLIRTRLSDGVEAVPLPILEFFSSILDQLEEDGYDFVREALHPYGWGVGHPDHSVADDIYQHASSSLPLVNAMLEHAFYADQHSAVELLEKLVNDESVQQTLPYRSGKISGTRYLLDAPAGAVSDFEPTIPRYWEWQEELDYEFELDDDVEQRIRQLVAEHGIDDDLPSDWEIADLTL
jgi:predicted  nucleic acid-binding Zn-ribbon protein